MDVGHASGVSNGGALPSVRHIGRCGLYTGPQTASVGPGTVARRSSTNTGRAPGSLLPGTTAGSSASGRACAMGLRRWVCTAAATSPPWRTVVRSLARTTGRPRRWPRGLWERVGLPPQLPLRSRERKVTLDQTKVPPRRDNDRGRGTRRLPSQCAAHATTRHPVVLAALAASRARRSWRTFRCLQPTDRREAP